MKRRYIFGNSLWLKDNRELTNGYIRKTLKEALIGAKEKHISNKIGFGVIISEKFVDGYWEFAHFYKIQN